MSSIIFYYIIFAHEFGRVLNEILLNTIPVNFIILYYTCIGVKQRHILFTPRGGSFPRRRITRLWFTRAVWSFQI